MFTFNNLTDENQSLFTRSGYTDRWKNSDRDKKLEYDLNKYKRTTSGSAGFITEYEAENSNLFQHGIGPNICPYLGSFLSKHNNSIKPIFARNLPIVRSQDVESSKGNGHLLTVAPTRTGKGSGQIVTNLLTKLGCAPCKGGALPVGERPTRLNRSGRKQSEQSWR